MPRPRSNRCSHGSHTTHKGIVIVCVLCPRTSHGPEGQCSAGRKACVCVCVCVCVKGVSEEGRVAALAAWGMRVGLTFDGCRVTDITRPRHRHAQAGAAVQGSSALAEAMSE